LDGGSARRKAATFIHKTAQTQKKLIETSMPRVGLEPAISAFELAKTVHALDREATVFGKIWFYTLLTSAGVEVALSNQLSDYCGIWI
jgi:hypothetical protein